MVTHSTDDVKNIIPKQKKKSTTNRDFFFSKEIIIQNIKGGCIKKTGNTRYD